MGGGINSSVPIGQKGSIIDVCSVSFFLLCEYVFVFCASASAEVEHTSLEQQVEFLLFQMGL